jgi:hypothetical protein
LPGQVDPHAVTRFAIIYLVTTVVIYGLGFIVIGFFPISRQTHEETLRRLAAEVEQSREPVDMLGGE